MASPSWSSAVTCPPTPPTSSFLGRHRKRRPVSCTLLTPVGGLQVSSCTFGVATPVLLALFVCICFLHHSTTFPRCLHVVCKHQFQRSAKSCITCASNILFPSFLFDAFFTVSFFSVPFPEAVMALVYFCIRDQIRLCAQLFKVSAVSLQDNWVRMNLASFAPGNSRTLLSMGGGGGGGGTSDRRPYIRLERSGNLQFGQTITKVGFEKKN